MVLFQRGWWVTKWSKGSCIKSCQCCHVVCTDFWTTALRCCAGVCSSWMSWSLHLQVQGASSI